MTSVLINGVAAVLGTNVDANRNLSFTTTNAIPVGVPITGFIAGPGIPTDPPPDPPVPSQEYEVIAKTKVDDSVDGRVEAQGVHRPSYLCGNSWAVSVLNNVVTNEFDLTAGDSVSVNEFEKSRFSYGCTDDSINDPPGWGPWGDSDYIDTYEEPVRSLSFGYIQPRGSGWPSVTNGWVYLRCGAEFWFPWENKTLASLTFKAPRQYDPNTTVIFTFEGVDYARPEGVPLDLSQVKYQHDQGATIGA